MIRYFVLGYAFFVTAFLILFGVGKYPNDNYSVTIFGYGRFGEGPTYLVSAALALAGAWNFVQWRKTRTGTATSSIHFVLANVWFSAGILLLVGSWAHPSSGQRASIFGFGRFENPAVYMTNFGLFAIAFLGLRRWSQSGRPGVSEVNYFALGYTWFILGMVLFLGIADHASGPRNAAIYGYGKLEGPQPYLAVGLLFLATFWNFRRWRRAKDEVPVLVPAPVPAPQPVEAVRPKFPWQYAAFGGFVILLILAMVVTQTGSKFQPRQPNAIPEFDGPMGIEADWPPDEIVDRTEFINLPGRRENDGNSVFLAIAVALPAIGLLWIAGCAIYIKLIRRASDNGQVRLRDVVVVGLIFSIAVALPAVALLAIGSLVPINERLEWQNRYRWIAMGPIYVCGPMLGMMWTILARAARQRNGKIANEEFPAAPEPEGWTRPQKRLIAGWFAFLATVVATLLAVWMMREYGRNDSIFNRLVVFFVFLSIIAFSISRGLYRWAYPEWYANRLTMLAPDLLPKEEAQHPAEPKAAVPAARACPKCQSPIAADAPQGLCPRCLMAGAFGSVLHPSRTGAFGGTFEPPSPEEVQEFFPHLEILGLIGHGGMGAVYQARQPNLDRIVAIKLIRPREDNPMFAERFVREARAMAKLTHPNIATIYESGDAGGSLYLIMEFIDGVTLREAIKSKAVTSATAMRIVGQLCEALEYAHSQGVVHRDIKPENILLDRAGKVKVVDFGLAKLADDNAMSLTHTRQAMGTPHYMAPEQWEKPTEVDHRADIYALGVVIYELLTGELPLGRFDPPSVKSRLDARIDEIVLKLLAKEPDRRYQRASDVRTALFNLGNLELEGVVRRQANGAGRYPFYEYKSKTEYFGWPLVHVVRGVDPRTGTRRIAKGWIAIGDVMAIGLLSLSGVLALGGFAIAGAFGLGVLAIVGGLAVGGVAIGGTAFGFLALGGVALGWLAVGGVAIGKYALGGTAVGQVTNRHGAISDLWEKMIADIGGWF